MNSAKEKELVRLIDEGKFYRWKIKVAKTFSMTTEGFYSVTEGLKVLRKYIKEYNLIERRTK